MRRNTIIQADACNAVLVMPRTSGSTADSPINQGGVARPRTIPLGHGRAALVDAADYEKLSKLEWRVERRKATSYACFSWRASPCQKDRIVYMHQMVLGYREGLIIDHINGNGLDNRRANLRHATRSLNSLNRHGVPSNHKSDLPMGVKQRKGRGRFQSKIICAGKQCHLGTFDTPAEAHAAYLEARAKSISEAEVAITEMQGSLT